MSIEEQQMVAEPVEGLEEILLDNFKPEQMTRISTLTNPLSTHDIPKREPRWLYLEPRRHARD